MSLNQPAEPTDLAALLTELVAEVTASSPEFSVNTVDPVTLLLRRTPIRRALRNLVENAPRHGGSIAVSLHQTQQGSEIRIDDRGPGIPEADLERVFDPFPCLETSRSCATLRAHGGHVRFLNRTDGGLRAELTAPQNAAVAV